MNTRGHYLRIVLVFRTTIDESRELLRTDTHIHRRAITWISSSDASAEPSDGMASELASSQEVGCKEDWSYGMRNLITAAITDLDNTTRLPSMPRIA